jgi:hypothetical protein
VDAIIGAGIFVMVMLSFAGYGFYKAWALGQRWSVKREVTEFRRARAAKLRRKEVRWVEPDAGAYSAWKAAEFARLEREWMEAWVAALPVEEQEYIRKYDFAGYRRGDAEIEKEIHRRLVHWERRRIENETGWLQ